MALRFEAWTLPWVDPANFKRKIAVLPVLPGTGTGDPRLFSMGGQGQCEVALGRFDRIGEVVGPSVGSLIRVYDGTTVIHEWICNRAPKNLSSATRTAPLSGPSLTSYFDQVVNYAREYPDILNPATQDTIWAGDNVLDNPDFEIADTESTQYTLWLDATGGDYILLVDGDPTAAIAYGASAAIVESRLQDLLGIDDVLVTVGDDNPGTEDNPYKIEFIVPAVIGTLTINDAGLTGLTEQGTLTVTQVGRDDIPNSWTPSQFADRRQDPRFHGRLSSDGFRLDDSITVFNGLKALRINPLERYGGAQQMVRVEPGMTYQAKIRVYTTDVDETFKFIIRNAYVDGEAPGLAQDGGSVPASTWTEFSFEVYIPQNVDTIIFRIAAVGKANPIPFWVDGAELLEGMPASSPGEIISTLLDTWSITHAATPRGPMLDWLDYSGFTDLLDSNGNAWSDLISFTAAYGETFGQILDKLVNMGFEWNVTPKATPVGGKTHDFHLYNKGGRDSSPSTAITMRQGVTDGEVIHRHPSYDAVLVEGTATYYEVEDAAAVAAFGRMEKFIAARDTADNDTLALIGDEALDAEASNRTAVRFNVVESLNHPRPGIDYLAGDTIPMQAPPSLLREYRRVVSFDYANTFPATYSVTGSRIFGGEAAAYELVWRLWRRFKRPDIPRRRGAEPPVGEKGGEFTIQVASPSSTTDEVLKADFVTDGTNDFAVIEQALDRAGAGVVVLASGQFVLGAGQFLNLVNERHIEGQGIGTILNTFEGILVSTGSSIKNLTVKGTGGAPQVYVISIGTEGYAEDIWLDEGTVDT